MKSLPLLALAAWLAAFTFPAHSAEPPRKLNVLFIVIDDMRAWAGYLGDAQAKTPNLDRLAKSGVAFTRSYAAYALCNPSRTVVLTGLRPSTTGVIDNAIDCRTAVPAEQPSLPASSVRKAGARWIGLKPAARIRSCTPARSSRSMKSSRWRSPRRRGSSSPRLSRSCARRMIRPLDTPEELVDYHTASFGVERLGQIYDRPFYLACGFGM